MSLHIQFVNITNKTHILCVLYGLNKLKKDRKTNNYIPCVYFFERTFGCVRISLQENLIRGGTPHYFCVHWRKQPFQISTQKRLI